MYQTLVYGCDDAFSYEPVRLQFQQSASSLEALQAKIDAYKAHFAGGYFSLLHLVVQKVNHEEGGAVELVHNEFGKNPLKVRVVINPEALAIKQAKLNKQKELV